MGLIICCPLLLSPCCFDFYIRQILQPPCLCISARIVISTFLHFAIYLRIIQAFDWKRKSLSFSELVQRFKSGYFFFQIFDIHYIWLYIENFNKDQTTLSCNIGFNIKININQLILRSIEIKGHRRNNLNSKKKKNINFQWNLTLILKKIWRKLHLLIVAAGKLLVRKDDRLRLTVSSSDYNLHISSLSLEVMVMKNRNIKIVKNQKS